MFDEMMDNLSIKYLLNKLAVKPNDVVTELDICNKLRIVHHLDLAVVNESFITSEKWSFRAAAKDLTITLPAFLHSL